MKYIHSILSVVLFSSILMSSCSEDETRIDTEYASLQFELNVIGGNPILHTRAVASDTIFVFVYDVVTNSVPVIQLKDGLKDENTILYYTPADSFARSSSYNIFSVATTDTDLQQKLGTLMSQTDLLNLIQDKADLNLDGSGYIISGGLRGVTFNNSSKAINLFRNVCRLDLTVTDKTTSKYKSIAASFDTPDQSYIFTSDVRNETGIPSSATDYLNQIALKDGETNTCYFFENSVGLTLNIQAIGIGNAGMDTTYNYKVVLANTERNTIYRVNAGLNLTELTVETVSSLDWKGNINDSQELIPVNP